MKYKLEVSADIDWLLVKPLVTCEETVFCYTSNLIRSLKHFVWERDYKMSWNSPLILGMIGWVAARIIYLDFVSRMELTRYISSTFGDISDLRLFINTVHPFLLDIATPEPHFWQFQPSNHFIYLLAGWLSLVCAIDLNCWNKEVVIFSLPRGNIASLLCCGSLDLLFVKDFGK